MAPFGQGVATPVARTATDGRDLVLDRKKSISQSNSRK